MQPEAVYAALLEAVRLVVRAEVEPLLRELEQLRRERDTPLRRVLQALLAVYGPGSAFTSGEVLELPRLPLPEREALREALAVALAGKAATSGRIGKLMRRLVDTGEVCAGCRLVSPTSEANRRLWLLERVGR